MSKFYLQPIDGRKSFYGKAVVKSVGNRLILQSYHTDVAEYDRDTETFRRLWGGYSATTMRHVNAFAAYLGMNAGGKKWWESLPVWH